MIALALFGSLASAQEMPEVPAMSVETWRLPVDAETTLWADDTSIREGLIARVTFGYQNTPLAWTWSDGDRIVVVRDAYSSDVVAAWSKGRARLGLSAPVWWHVAGDAIEGARGVGDVSLDGKAVALERDDNPLGLAVTARMVLPTANVEAPVGQGGLGFEAAVVADREVGPILLAANLGGRFGPEAELENVTLDDALVARLGAGWSRNDALGASLDFGSRFNLVAEGSDGVGAPIEALVGAWARVPGSDVVVRGGLGRGLTPGIGAPVGRAVLAVGWEPPSDRDSDEDTIADSVDSCVYDPEDFDGFADDDGCPEADNDSDGVADLTDACPLVGEDIDGWEDADGCPDPNTRVTLKVVDPDGKPVSARIQLGDRSVEGAEMTAELVSGVFDVEIVAEGFAPHGGSVAVPNGPPIEIVRKLKRPDPTTGTLSLTVTDLAGHPVAAWWVVDGNAPSELRDGQGQATLAPGVHQLVVTADGYVPVSFPALVDLGKDAQLSVMLQPVRVQVTREKLEITEKVYFETNKATILPVSYPLLDQIASILLDRPDIVRVRIEGHTDSRGTDAYNQRLSEARAESVRAFLVERGVEASRLVFQGYGESRPVDDREVAEAWDANRRVEFFIEAWAE